MNDDKNNNPIDASVKNNDDYQKIIDDYAATIKSENTTKPEEPQESKLDTEENLSLKDINSLQLEAPDPVLGLPETPVETPVETLNPIEEDFQPIREDNLPPLPTSPNIDEVKDQVNEILNYPTRSDDTNESLPPEIKSSSNIPKILFFISLSVFILIIGALVYFLTSGSKSTDKSDSTITITPTVSVVACTLNGMSFGIGQSFKSADGCNTCSCTAPDVIACTEMACEITPTNTATKSAVKTTTITPTKSATKSAEFSVLKRVPQGVEIGDESGKILVSSPLKSISITFNDKADSKTITNDTFYVLDGIDSKVAGKITYDSKTYTATITFNSPINISERVTVVIKGIKDSTGNLIKDLTYNIDIKI